MLEQVRIKRFYIHKNIYLTNKELQCLYLLSSGKTAKGIGTQLKISSRTVEEHLNSIKFKTGIRYKNQLISFFEDSALNSYCLK
ncbi:helix-turn-helix transcriptional regulator [Candidatus Tisiphia endosymbiont of Micropterix aruncella]|uniref:helix-turn-helix transcriptional regulator n=1 Tax=Candidatus Tisiphia endosymbiont of Micropterix aruncella TaxID=3066271 RepID=UPI003AA9A0CA